MINIKIIDKDKFTGVLEDSYTIGEHDILLHNNMPVDCNSYTSTYLKDRLYYNNVEFKTIAQCKNCGEWTEDYITINSRHGNFQVCCECADNYFYCEDCEEYYDDTYDTFETIGGRVICEDCRYNDYVECHDCGAIVRCGSDMAYYCDDCDEYFCERCWDEHYHEENLLYDYHDFHDWQLKKTDNEEEPPFYIGHELEIDDGSNMSAAVDTISSIGGICMHDGSLGVKGIEFISHPFSYNYMLSQEQAYRNAFDKLANEYGYKSHNTSTCGLHFHVTRPTDTKIIDRIILFMETYKEEIIQLSRRKSGELNHWSRFLSDKKSTVDEKIIKSLDYIVKNKETCDRYMALNLTNSKTIEFRFFKGTLKYETFMADFEFINNLVTFASDLKLPVEELTWTKVTSVGRFLPQYIEENNLKSNKPIVDYSKETLIEFNTKKAEIQEKAASLITEILKIIGNKARTKNNTSSKIKDTYNIIYNYNQSLKELYHVVYALEGTDVFNYDRLDECNADLRFIKERLGK